MVPHVNLSSFAGGGKTTISKLLLEMYHTVLIPKITTRPRRPAEEISEYIFVSEKEFEFRRLRGHFLAVEAIEQNGGFHYYAIPVVEEWPSIPEGTELVLSAFGEKARIAQEHFPGLKLVFISLRDRNLLAERLRNRCLVDGGNFDKKWAQNERYFASHIERQYDFVVYNDGTPKECAVDIMAIIQER